MLGLYSLPGLPFAAGRACAARGEWGEIFKRREKSSGSASRCDGDASETMILGLGMGGACSLRGEDGRAVEGLGVDEDGCEGLSGRSRGAAILRKRKDEFARIC